MSLTSVVMILIEVRLEEDTGQCRLFRSRLDQLVKKSLPGLEDNRSWTPGM